MVDLDDTYTILVLLATLLFSVPLALMTVALLVMGWTTHGILIGVVLAAIPLGALIGLVYTSGRLIRSMDEELDAEFVDDEYIMELRAQHARGEITESMFEDRVREHLNARRTSADDAEREPDVERDPDAETEPHESDRE